MLGFLAILQNYQANIDIGFKYLESSFPTLDKEYMIFL